MLFHQLEEWLAVEWVFLASFVSIAILMLAGVLVRRSLADGSRGVLPDEGISTRNVVEVVVELA